MATLQKANRVITVEEDRVEGYLKRGYDQIDGKGGVVKSATGGKDVSVAEFNKLQKAYDALKNEYRDLKDKNANSEKIEARVEELYEENIELKKKAEDFAEKGKALQAENSRLKGKK